MAHFAKLGTGNIVTAVHVVSNDVATTEQAGVDFLNDLYKTRDVWKQTSYNTKGGVHLLGETPFRKNYASIGYTYNQTKDAFIPPKPFASWTWDTTKKCWVAPIEQPENADYWNEENQTWV